MKKNYLPVIILAVLLSACEHLGPQGFGKIPLDQGLSVVDKKVSEEQKAFPQVANPSRGEQEGIEKAQLYPGDGDLIGSVATSPGGGQPKAAGKYTLNFEEAELGEVVKVIINDTLNESYVINPKVRGKVTLQTSRPLTREELLPTLELLLQVNNAVLIKKGGIYQIEPAASALQGGGVLTGIPGGKLPAGYQIQIVPLQYVGVTEMQNILKPMVTPTTILRADPARNLLMLAGTAEQLKGIRETIKIFDVDYMQGMSFGIFPLHNVDVATIYEELDDIFGLSGEGPMAGMFKIIPIERLNALLVITPQSRYLQKVRTWISRLDKANTSAGGGVIVYRVQHLKAVDLAATLNDIFITGRRKTTRPPSLAPGRKAVKITSKGTQQKGARRRSANRQINITAANMGDVRIIADEQNNSLIIVATAQEYEAIRTVIKQLDIQPLQVLIEAKILAIRLNDDLKYGVEWKFKNSLPGGRNGVGQLGDALGLAADITTATATGGFSYLIRKANNIEAIIHASADKNNLKVLSSPSMMVLNNQQAKIQVGDQVPIRTTQSTNTNASLNPIQTSSIEMRDTGVTLTVTPRVNAGGMVIMDIEQSVNDAVPTTTSGIDSPTILKRSFNSNVAIHSGETVVLGGLISEKYNDTKSGVPWLMDIPYLGSAFSSTTRTKERNELVVLITPQVIENKLDAREVTRAYKRSLELIFEDVEAMKKASGAGATQP